VWAEQLGLGISLRDRKYKFQQYWRTNDNHAPNSNDSTVVAPSKSNKILGGGRGKKLTLTATLICRTATIDGFTVTVAKEVAILIASYI